MQTTLKSFKGIKCLVVGDLMVDKYWNGTSSRISPEAPVPILNVISSNNRLGGAANVAANISSLGATTGIISVVGNDTEGKWILASLKKSGINTNVFLEDDLSTIVKLRVMSKKHQMIRLDFEEENHYQNYSKSIYNKYAEQIDNYDLVVLSDYNKGVLANTSNKIIELAKIKNIPVIADPKGSDFSRYMGCTVLTPNKSEFEAIVGKCNDKVDIESKGKILRKELNIDTLIITCGEEGISVISKDIDPFHIGTDVKDVVDVTGAGDTVMAVLSCAISQGVDLKTAILWCNIAAGINVQKTGTSVISFNELKNGLNYNTTNKIKTLDEIKKDTFLYKENNKKIVFTNGCFDILHSGHAKYLQEAKKKGDYLVVAVNSDESVRKLKGSSRPINNVDLRMQLLSSLEVVDAVVCFSQDTPLDIIKIIKPDVLVKGGDYKTSQIVGADFVLQNGGRVEVVTFIHGLSSSNILEKVLEL